MHQGPLIWMLHCPARFAVGRGPRQWPGGKDRSHAKTRRREGTQRNYTSTINFARGFRRRSNRRATKAATPLGLDRCASRFPKVAAARQPWATGATPLGLKTGQGALLLTVIDRSRRAEVSICGSMGKFVEMPSQSCTASARFLIETEDRSALGPLRRCIK